MPGELNIIDVRMCKQLDAVNDRVVLRGCMDGSATVIKTILQSTRRRIFFNNAVTLYGRGLYVSLIWEAEQSIVETGPSVQAIVYCVFTVKIMHKHTNTFHCRFNPKIVLLTVSRHVNCTK